MPRNKLRSVLLATAICLPAAALALPDGEGREAVESVCSACHGVNLIERSSGYSAEHWRFFGRDDDRPVRRSCDAG